MYSPLADHVRYSEKFSHGCGVPFCNHAWRISKHGLCEFHEKLANRQAGEPFTYDVEELSPEEARAAWEAHDAKHLQRIPYHLIMAYLWPGPYLEERSRSTRRHRSQEARQQEENDR